MGFVLRVWADWDYWRWFDGLFPGLWQAAPGSTLSQDASLYLQQAGPPGYLHAPLWAEQPYYRPPFASIYFGALFDLCRFDRGVAAALQAVLAMTGYLAIFSLARRNFGTRVALAGTALAAIHPVLIFFDRAIEDSALSFVLAAHALNVLDRLLRRRAMSDALLCGLLLAACGMTRSNYLLLTVMALVWLVVGWKRIAVQPCSGTPIARLSFIFVPVAVVTLALLAISGVNHGELPLRGLYVYGLPFFQRAILALALAPFAVYFLRRAMATRQHEEAWPAALVTSIGTLVLPPVGLAALLLSRARLPVARESTSIATGSSPGRGRYAVAMAASVALFAALSSAHNYLAGGSWSPVVSTLGQNLFWGNTPFEYYRTELAGPTGIPWISPFEPTSVLFQQIKERYPTLSGDAALRKAALDTMAADPMAAAARILRKAARNLAYDEIPRNENLAVESAASPILSIPRLPFALILALALWAVAAAPTGQRFWWSLLLFPWIVDLVSETVFFNAARYRAFAIPFLLPLAVMGAVQLADRSIAWRAKGAFAVLAITAVSWGFGAMPAGESASERATTLYKMARLEFYEDHAFLPGLRPHRPDVLEARLQAALAESPRHLSAHMLHIMWLLEGGDVAGARAEQEQLAARCPSDDMLCRDFAKRIAGVIAAPEAYRADLTRRLEQKRRDVDEWLRQRSVLR